MTAPEHAPGYVPNAQYSQEDWDEVSDNPEWTEGDFAVARPFAETFPELAEALRRQRGSQRAPTKVPVTIRLDRSVVEAFKATGTGWQTRMNAVLRDAAAALPHERTEP